MAKGEAKKNNELNKINLDRSTEVFNEGRSGLDAAQTRDKDLYDSLRQQIATQGDSARPGYTEFSQTGGVDPRLSAGVRQDQNAYRNFARTPISGAVSNRVRGNGVYDDLTRTGGYSAGDRYDVMARATNVGKSLYQNLQDEMRRNSASTGGFININPSLNRLTRQSAFDANDASLNARIGLADSIRQGRLQGAAGMSDAERYLQSENDNRFLGGMSGAMQGNAQLANIGQMIQSGRLAGLGGLSSLDQQRIASELALRGSRPEEVNMYNQLRMQSIGQSSTDVGQRMQYNPNVSTWDRIRQGIGMVAPIATGLLTSGIIGGGGGGSGITSTQGGPGGDYSGIRR